jgi:PAS domain S-box-containing protein
MRDQDKTKQQLVAELVQLRQRVAEVQANGQGGEPEARSLPSPTRPEDGRQRSRLHAILTAAIECLPFEFFAIGPDRRYILQNAVSRQHAGEAIGKCPEDVMGKHLTACYPEGYMFRRETEILPALLQEGHWEGELVFSSAGKTMYVLQHSFLIEDENGDPSHIASVSTDITERKQAEEALERERQTLWQMLQASDHERQTIALTNACIHSKSAKVTVTMAQEGPEVRLEVRDWGVGFDPETVVKGHFGLEGIRQRARLLGGRLTIESRPGAGTRVQVVVPIVEQPSAG